MDWAEGARPFADKSTFIDVVLQRRRNAIAHGEDTFVALNDLDQISDDTIGLMRAFGDEFETATNYPLVRIVNNATGHVFYARTHDHSTMGIATKSFPTYTYFDVPANMETGASKLYVVANGFQSNPIQVTVN